MINPNIPQTALAKEAEMKIDTKISRCRNLKHDTCLDALLSEFSEEDVYYCLTCKTIVIEHWKDDEYVTKYILPIDTPRKEITRLLTLLPAQ